jgi:hypothetical protein
MASINKTPHYNLSQFGDSPDDKPSWRGDYTSDMSKIDSQMYRNETDATTATSTANTAKNTADNALTLAKTNESNIGEQESYFSALGVTSQQTAQSLMSTINGKAENTTVTALQGTVSGLSDTVAGKAENTTVTALQGTVSGLSDTVAGKADASSVYTKAQSDTTFTKQGGYSGTAQALDQRINSNTSWRDAWLSGWKMGTVSHANSSGVSIIERNTKMNFMYNETIGAFKFYGDVLGQGLNASGAYLTLTAQLPSSMHPGSEVRYMGVGFYVAGDSSIGNIPSSTHPIGGWPASFKITAGGQIQATFQYDSTPPTSGTNWTGGQMRIYAAFTQSIYLSPTVSPTA